MGKNGFTLIELLAVIIILAVVALIATPIVLDVIKDARKSGDMSNTSYYASALELKLAENYIKNNGSYSTDVDKLVNETVTNGKKPDNCEIKISEGTVLLRNCESKSGKYSYANKKIYDMSIEEEVTIFEAIWNDIIEYTYEDNSGASYPEIDNGLIPIVYDGTNWVVADITKKWYDYDTKEWANAVIVKPAEKSKYIKDFVVLDEDILAYYVWIPRYKYAVPAGGSVGNEKQINVIFENSTTTKSTGTAVDTDYYTHPAFTFGDTELEGIWVGKFELTGDTITPTVLPDVSSLRSVSISRYFTTIQKFGMNQIYNLDSSKVDSHMIKNIEWGAVAYLTQSKYGRCINNVCEEVAINNSRKYLTGGGDYKGNINQSTTNNIYGIYDMNNGAFEYVMGNYNNMLGVSNFSQMPEEKYYDKYTTKTGHKGDATNADSTDGWYSDNRYFVNEKGSWFNRGGGINGGAGGGIFSFNVYQYDYSSDGSTRSVLTRP